MPYDFELPGIIDFHVHVGEKIASFTLADSFKSLSALAKRNGIIAIGAFVTEEEGISLAKKLQKMREDARRDFSGHVHWHLTPVKSGFEEISKILDEDCDLKFYTTYRQAGLYCPYKRLEEWMQAFPHTRFLVHCEDDATIGEYSNRESFSAPFKHCLRRPEIAEIRAVEKVLDLALKYNHPVHIVHVSTPAAALLIRQAKADCHPPYADRAALITCETAPHYLIYNQDRLLEENAHRYLCSPPYRSESSRGQLLEFLQDGVFDIVASDHCPFSNADKDRNKDNLELVPNGIPGMGTLFSSLYEHFVKTDKLRLEHLIHLCCVNPAKLMKIKEHANDY